MKKKIMFSLIAGLLLLSATLFAGERPHGHKYYVRHSKNHKVHKAHKPDRMVDKTYQN
jgi:hypothetical protein